MTHAALSLFVVQVTDVDFSVVFFFFNDTATTEIYTLSLHDALPIWGLGVYIFRGADMVNNTLILAGALPAALMRSEEHTSELQSQSNLVCRLLLEKKKKNTRRCFPLHGRRSTTDHDFHHSPHLERNV